VETGEWIDSLRAVLHHQGPERAAFLLEKLADEAQHAGVTAVPVVNLVRLAQGNESAESSAR
jgi:pyruvate dehydrogenase E1 component